MRRRYALVILLAVGAGQAVAQGAAVPGQEIKFQEGVYARALPRDLDAPPVPREFRGAWVATVDNIDWPSKPGLPVEQQKAEMIAILDRAAQLKLNALVFQARPACDAFYASTREPWSEFLTGQMGKAPEPFYDPLEFTVTEAHKR